MNTFPPAPSLTPTFQGPGWTVLRLERGCAHRGAKTYSRGGAPLGLPCPGCCLGLGALATRSLGAPWELPARPCVPGRPQGALPARPHRRSPVSGAEAGAEAWLCSLAVSDGRKSELGVADTRDFCPPPPTGPGPGCFLSSSGQVLRDLLPRPKLSLHSHQLHPTHQVLGGRGLCVMPTISRALGTDWKLGPVLPHLYSIQALTQPPRSGSQARPPPPGK